MHAKLNAAHLEYVLLFTGRSTRSTTPFLSCATNSNDLFLLTTTFMRDKINSTSCTAYYEADQQP